MYVRRTSYGEKWLMCFGLAGVYDDMYDAISYGEKRVGRCVIEWLDLWTREMEGAGWKERQRKREVARDHAHHPPLPHYAYDPIHYVLADFCV